MKPSDEPIPGFYLTRLVRGGPMTPVEIFVDPRLEAGFGALVVGEMVDVFRVWPHCGRNPIDAEEYRYRMALLANGEDSGEIDRRKPIDHLKTRPMF